MAQRRKPSEAPRRAAQSTPQEVSVNVRARSEALDPKQVTSIVNGNRVVFLGKGVCGAVLSFFPSGTESRRE